MKFIRVISIVLLIFVAINALAAGYLFIIDPSGSKLQIPISWLQHSPFDNFLMPGIVLFVVNGLLNVIAATFAIFKWKNYAKQITLQGILLSGWIVVQVIMLQELYFLHYIFVGIGILLFIFGIRLKSYNQK